VSIFETIGLAFVIFTSAFGTIQLGLAIYDSMVQAKRHRLRGSVEENLDLERAMEKRFFERFGVK